MGNKNNTQDYKDFDWNDIELHEFLPEPKSHSGELITNTDESLYMGIKASESDFDEYVKACKEMGYTVESNESNQLYSAYNSDGYDLSLIFYDDHYSLNLDVPEKMEEIEWPDSDLAKMLPVPKSKTGKINNDSSDYLSVLIDKTSESDFKEYVKDCKEKGFDVDYSNGDAYYRAKNSKGYSLEVSLSAFDVMDIYLSTPEEETTQAETSKAESSKSESSKAESSKAESSKAESSKAKSSKSESADDSDSSSLNDNHNAIISEAEVAFENYGKAMYPYGFECHWFTNRLATEVNEDGTCLLKVGVTIKNQYGVTMETVAEGKVNGSNVTYFFVYS